MDNYTKAAAKLFDIPEADVTPEQRARAKQIAFQMVYGNTTPEVQAELESKNILTHRLHPPKYRWEKSKCDACGATGEDLKFPCGLPLPEYLAAQQKHS